MKRLEDLNISGQTVLLRLNLNVPLKDGKIVDDFRLRVVLPTIDYVKERARKTVICAHLGRPEGRDMAFSLQPVADALVKRYGHLFSFLNDCVGTDVKHTIETAPDGSIILLENVRFHSGERANDDLFGAQLASLADVFVNDAFGDSYESYASVVWPAKLLPSAAGMRLQRELQALEKLKDRPDHPFVLLVGGVKIAEKMGTLRKLGEKADTILVGGGIANTLLLAKGMDMQDSLVQEKEVAMAKELLQQFAGKLVVPVDARVAKRGPTGKIDEKSLRETAVDSLAVGEAAYDIGPKTLEIYKKACDAAKDVFWAGPLGYIEWDQTAASSKALLRMLSEHPNYSVIGGGETASLVSAMGVAEKMDFVSTGGGAALKYLSGEPLPGLQALS